MHGIHPVGRFLFSLVGLLVPALTGSRMAHGRCLTLDDVVQRFASRSESVAVAQAEVAAAEAQLRAVRAAVLPSLSLTGTALQQDVPTASGSNVQSPNSMQTGAKLVLSQPVFKGGREYALMRSARAQVEASKSALEGAKNMAAAEAAAAYFDQQLASAEVDALEELTKVSQRRFADIKKRVAIGRSRLADLLGAEAQAQSAKAQLESARLTMASAERKLVSLLGGVVSGEISGHPISGTCKANKDKAEVSGVARRQSRSSGYDWGRIEKMVLARPEIDSARIAVEIAAAGIAAARAGHLPSIDVVGNYYVKRGDSRFANGKWDLLVNATLPIFSGGSVRAAVEEAQARELQQSEIYRLKQREALVEARDLWGRLEAGRSQMSLLKSSAAKSEAYYARVAKDERLGLGSSLETLQALNASIDARRSLERFEIERRALAFKLDLATGSYPLKHGDGATRQTVFD